MTSAVLALLVASPVQFEGQSTFERLVRSADRATLARMTRAERLAHFAQQLIGKPYVGWTLERDVQQEFCFVTMDGLDCVTLMETALGMARLPWQSRKLLGPQDLVQAVTFTRYRGGVVDGYLSRLHYTSDWIADNVRKGVVRDVTPGLRGARPFDVPIHFMSTNAKVYRQLAANPDLIPALKKIEAEVSALPKWYVPKASAAQAERGLRTGDIIGITDSRPGMDYAHVGLIVVIEGVPRFLHASSTAKEVVLDVRLSEYLQRVKSNTGFTAVRPL